MAEENRGLMPQAVSGVCLTFGAQNPNLQQEKGHLQNFLVEVMYS